MELTQALTLSTENFERLLDQVTEAQLALPTPCEDWLVTDLLNHVTRGSEMAAALVAGASQAEATGFLSMEPPSEPIEECRRALGAQLRALTAADDLDQVVHHLVGDVPVRQLFDFRIGDLVLHAWDLARGIGADDTLPSDLVAHAYGALQPMEAIIGQIGIFGTGPSGTLDADADLQLKLLDLTGRRP